MARRVLVIMLLSILLLSLTSGCRPNNEEEVRIGVLHMERLIAESQTAQSFQERLDGKGEEIQAEFYAISLELNDLSRSRKQQEYYDRFLEYKRELEGELNQLIEKELESICQEKNIRVVIDKGSVQYGGVDLTDELIEALEGRGDDGV